MQGLLQEINHLLSTKYELNLRAITSNRPISYVRVPRTKSDNASNHLVILSRFPLVLLSCQLVFESPIVARPSRPLVKPPSRLLAASAGCRIASRRPFVAPPSRRLIVPDGCCVDSRRAAVSSTHRAALSAIERPHHRRHCTPSSPSTAATAATAAATCVVERFTLVH